MRRQKGISGKHEHVKSGEEFWVSGSKKDGTDRHWAGSGSVEVDDDVLDEYLGMVTPVFRNKILSRR